MKSLLLLSLLFPLLSFSQLNPSKGYPTFNGGSESDSPYDKMEFIRFKTQDFIQDNVDSEFIQKYFKVNDSIEFDLSYLIDSNGTVKENDITVYTNIDFFNEKIKSTLKSLPTFTPAISSYNQKTYDFKVEFRPEFTIDSNYKFVPIYRKLTKHHAEFPIDPKEAEYVKNIEPIRGKNYRGIITVIIYFSTDDKKNHFNVRAYSESELFSQRAIKEFKDNKLMFRNGNLQLRKNTNYQLQISMRLFESRKAYEEFIKTGTITVKY
ncbi:hypothetical protein [Mangrovimonas sp. ST2L15]|uniref:hypothetical protein n=1 Tax=Mangrovimonas sp. ST2L15 TaxID=1645916 RepID=UPI0006B64536|nr:hypothetical protein [Mangrovimonas sp. ST2L15]